MEITKVNNMSDSFNALNQTHLLDINSLSKDDISSIIDLARKYLEINKESDKKHPILKGKTLINLFFENSTRTRSSFEIAGKRMGADVINIQASVSSASKGESLLDTALTLNAMSPDFITIRHPDSGAAKLFSKYVDCPVINAGDGSHQHPTQALLDALTISNNKKTLSGLKIAICGDILHSRVARSNINLLSKMGSEVRLIAPPTMLPRNDDYLGVKCYNNMEKGIEDVDVIMMLRIQMERMSGCYLTSHREYFQLYGLDHEKMSNAKESAIIMHPGPINRGLEISGDLADDTSKNVILNQVENGVAIRQAILEMIDKN